MTTRSLSRAYHRRLSMDSQLANGGSPTLGRRLSVTGEPGDLEALAEWQELALLPLKEDLADWLATTLGIPITVDNFFDVLDNGVHLCQLVRLIQGRAVDLQRDGAHNEIMIPTTRIKCKESARSGTWFARDNIANFLQWCRNCGVKEECLFETEELVCHRQRKNILLCVMEIARIASKFDIEPPGLVSLEKEIEREEQEVFKVSSVPDKKPITNGTPPPTNGTPPPTNGTPPPTNGTQTPTGRRSPMPSSISDSDQKRSPTSTRSSGSDQSHTSTPTLPLGSDKSHTSTPTRPLGSDQSHTSTPTRPLGSDQSHTSTPTRPLGSDQSHTSTPTRTLGSDQSRTPTPTRSMEPEWSHTLNPTWIPGSDRTHSPAPTEMSGSDWTRSPAPTEMSGADRTRTPTPTRIPGPERTRTPTPTRIPAPDRKRTPTPTRASALPQSQRRPSSAGSQRRRTSSVSSLSSNPDDLDRKVQRIFGTCQCNNCYQVERLAEGRYMLGGKAVFVRLLKGKHVMVRVGGGWDTLEHYVATHDPCKVVEIHRTHSSISLVEAQPDQGRYVHIQGRYRSKSTVTSPKS